MPESFKIDSTNNQSGLSIGPTPAAPNPSAPSPAAAPKATAAPAAAPAESSSGISNFFSENKPKTQDSKMVSSIIAPKDASQKLKSILGPSPALEKNIEQAREDALRKKSFTTKMAFGVVVLAGLASGLFFYSQLAPNFDLFGTNVTRRIADVNFNLRQVQTDLNKWNYLTAQMHLNDFGYEADRFLGNAARLDNPQLSTNEKAQALNEIDASKQVLPDLLGKIRSLLTKDITVSTFQIEGEAPVTPEEAKLQAENDLRLALQADLKKLPKDSADPEDILNIKFIQNTIKLVGNKGLPQALQQTSVDNFKKDLDEYQASSDPQKQKALRDLVAKILSSTKSDLATIADIKSNRIEWASIIKQIESETLNVDKSYGQQVLYESLGGVMYSGYEFDAVNNKIVLSGISKTSDGSNFTLLSNLIDQMESSSYFQDVEMRSFSKSKSGTGSSEGYIASFKIDLRLETGKSSTRDKSNALKASTNQPDDAGQQTAVKVPVIPVEKVPVKEQPLDLNQSISADVLLPQL